MSDFDMKLNYDDRHRNMFLTIIADIKGIGNNCLVLTQDDKWVVITMTTPLTEIRIPKSLVTREPTIFSESIRNLASKLERKVIFR